MPHFYVEQNNIKDDVIEVIEPNLLHHLTVARRIKLNEIIKFIDGDKNVYKAQVINISKKNLVAKIIEKEKSTRFLKYDICLVQSILAPDGQSDLIANATQTGVKTIYPVVSENCSSKIKNAEKWKKIADENFKQCERADFVQIEQPKGLIEVISRFKKENVLIFAEKFENISIEKSLQDIDKNSKIAVVIGPEGGFSKNEFDYFKKEGYKLISLGCMIYKAPNAVIAAISNVTSRLA
ncbi:RsmE family RNA methyltransferase [bacterium]|nr:RsmE family RNA methyltransferase [bacterium]